MEAAEELKPMATARLVQRPRALHTCAVSALTVARKAYQRVEDLGGPVRSLAKKLAPWAALILLPLQQVLLCLLSLADGYLLAVEDAVISVFPPAAYLFGLLDDLAAFSEGLPKKFDDAADGLPAKIRAAPLIGWIATELGEGWKILASEWEHGRAGNEEREIRVDSACDEHPAAVGSLMEKEGADHAGNEEREIRAEEEESAGKTAAKDAARRGSPQRGSEVDPILELFDGGWSMHRG